MTTHVAWKAHYSVGNESLDAQHRQILTLVNDLYFALEKDNSGAVIESLLRRLLQYAQSHFGYEERLMTESGYPDLAEHKASHDRMRRRTDGLLEHAGLVMPEDLLHFLKDWWLNHIQGGRQEVLAVPPHPRECVGSGLLESHPRKNVHDHRLLDDRHRP